MSQSQANVWIHKLSHVLKMALEEENLLPERNPQHLEELLAACTSAEFIIDGTERRRQRHKDPQTQKTYYSGKKKPTRTRTILLSMSMSAKSST